MADYLVSRLRQKQKHGEPIVSITAYDYFTALLAKQADVDFVLVGDSMGNVIQGLDTTIPVTLEQAIYHTKIVCRHFPHERVVLDMPFGTFKLDAQETINNCVRAFKESGCGGVKIEGATTDNIIAINALSEQGIPVVGHLGLLPQRVHAEGGYRSQGKTTKQVEQLLSDARALEQAGACCIVLECVVPKVAEQITAEIGIPTIGIGSGPQTNGQIIVVHDILGMLPGDHPSFVKQYANLFETACRAVSEYSSEVGSREFPPTAASQKHSKMYG